LDFTFGFHFSSEFRFFSILSGGRGAAQAKPVQITALAIEANKFKDTLPAGVAAEC
jgi:hypothetical protein